MRIHASCVARDAHGLLLLGPSGAGKSDLAFRLIDHGFTLIADDQVEFVDGIARPVDALAGLLEIRGLGLLRLPFASSARVVLALDLGRAPARLPMPERAEVGPMPLLAFDPRPASAVPRAIAALDCVLGRRALAAGFLATATPRA